MEKRILLAVCASLAFAGQVHASAPIVNAAGNLMMKGAAAGITGMYCAERWPNGYNLISSSVINAVRSAPVAQAAQLTEIQIDAMVSQGLTEGLKSASQQQDGPSLMREMAPFFIKSGAALAGIWLVYDYTFGNGYTRKLIRNVQKELQEHSEKTEGNFAKVKKALSIIWDHLKGIKKDVNKIQKDVNSLNQKTDKIDRKQERTDIRVVALLKATKALAENKNQEAAEAAQRGIDQKLATQEELSSAEASVEDNSTDDQFMKDLTADPKAIDESPSVVSTEETSEQPAESTFWTKAKTFAGWWSRS